MNFLYKFLSEDTLTDTVIIKGVQFLANLLLILSALKYLVRL